MTALQKVNLGTAPAGTDGDTVRTANVKANANIDVLNTQAALTSSSPNAVRDLTAADMGKRINFTPTAAAAPHFPAANTTGADQVVAVHNLSPTYDITMAVATGSGDTAPTIVVVKPGELVLWETDGVSVWRTIGRKKAFDEVVQGKLSVAGAYSGSSAAYTGNVTVGGTLSVTGAVTGTSFTGKWLQASYTLVTTTANSSTALNVAPSGGAGNVGQVTVFGAADTANAPFVAMYSTGTYNIINSAKNGTGAALPLDFYINNAYAARIGTSKALLVGGTNEYITGGVQVETAGYQMVLRNNQTAAGKLWLLGPNTANNFVLFNQGAVGVYVVDGGTAWAGQSDGRLKNVRSELTGVLDAVASLSTVRYTWKIDDDHAEALGEASTSKVQIGVIAQEVQKYFPEIVDVADPERGYLGVQYPHLATIALAAIKELKAELDAAKARIDALEARS